MIPECEQLATLHPRHQLGVVPGIAAALDGARRIASRPAEREEQTRAGVELGVYLSRLGTLDKLFSAWATHDKVPWAKWIEWAEDVAPARAGRLAVRQPDDGGPGAVEKPVEKRQRRRLHLGHADGLRQL